MSDEHQGLEHVEDFEASLLSEVDLTHDEGESLRLADDDSLAIAQGQAPAKSFPPSGAKPTSISGSEITDSPTAPTQVTQGWEGKRLSHFRLMRLLGSGYAGIVFQAEDINLKRIVALKVLRRQIKGISDVERVDRFLLEARTAAALDHPCITQVYEINEQAGWWYIAMEYLEGGSLGDLLKTVGTIAPGQAALMVLDAARGLVAAHAAGVIHRDIKPGNLMLSRLGRCKLVDFGLVKSAAADNPFREDDLRMVGSPNYVAPEVIREEGATAASDVYSLGATLYHLLTGTALFDGGSIGDVLRKHIDTPAPDVRLKTPTCSDALANIIGRSLAKAPAERPSVDEIAAVLQAEVMAAHLTAPPSSGFGSSVSGIGSSGGFAHPAAASTSSATLPPASAISTTGASPSAPASHHKMLLAAAIAGAATSVLLGWLVLNHNQETPKQTDASAASATAGAAATSTSQPPTTGAAPLPPISNGIGMTLAHIPAGKFTMGSPANEPGRNSDERRVDVTISGDFYMSVVEVTQAQWTAVMGKDYIPPEGVHPTEEGELRFVGDTLPVNVSWFEAAEFCRLLSVREHATYRLPTEAEWEYACRAGTTTAFNSGAALDPAAANVDADLAQSPLAKPLRRPMPVGSFEPNAWGLYDMHGNVMEWCADWMAPYTIGPLKDPAGPANGTTRVVRGGSWDSYPRVARSANRWDSYPFVRTDYIGFRPVLDKHAPLVEQPTFLAHRSSAPAPAPKESLAADAQAPHSDRVALDPNLPAYKPQQVLSQRARSAGSDSMDRLLRQWENRFRDWHKDATFRNEGLGSGTAIPALVEGIAHFGPMSRPITPDELKLFQGEYGYEPTQLRVATDALAIYVHPTNPIATRGLSLAELDAVLSATRKRGFPREVAKWGDLGLEGEWADRPIHVYGHNPASGTYGVIRDAVLQGGDFKPSTAQLVGSAEVVESVAVDPSAIGYSGIGYLRADVRTAPLRASDDSQPIEPTAEAASDGSYPLARPMLLTIDRPPGERLSPLVSEFLRFVYSKEGQQVVIGAGYFPLSGEVAREQARRIDLDAAAP